LIPGSIVFGVFYVISLAVASDESFGGSNGWLVVPVVGPFISLATREEERCDQFGNCNNADNARLALMIDGVAQAAGATLLGFGLFTRSKSLERSPAYLTNVYPTSFGEGRYGLAATGRF
jgi:hypothetical protein